MPVHLLRIPTSLRVRLLFRSGAAELHHVPTWLRLPFNEPRLLSTDSLPSWHLLDWRASTVHHLLSRLRLPIHHPCRRRHVPQRYLLRSGSIKLHDLPSRILLPPDCSGRVHAYVRPAGHRSSSRVRAWLVRESWKLRLHFVPPRLHLHVDKRSGWRPHHVPSRILHRDWLDLRSHRRDKLRRVRWW